MSVRQHAIVLAIATMALPAAFAAQPGTFVGGEAGWVDRPAQSSLSPAQVQGEFLKFRASPVAADGGRYVGGEQGYAFPAHMYARQGGKCVCIDKIAHNPKPDASRSPGEEQAYQQQYPA